MKISTLVLSFLLSLGISFSLVAQTCSPESTISTQTQIDSLVENCTIINGDLIIEGDSIKDLNPLNNIGEITGNLIIRNCPNLTNLEGLDLITEIGGDFIIQNNGITGFGGFSYELLSIGGNFHVGDNDSLSSIAILFNLESIGGKLTIHNNAKLNSVKDFVSLKTVTGDFEIISNGNLENIDFSALENVSSALTIMNNSGNFTLNGFANLQSIATEFQISQNNGLKQVNGFKALTSNSEINIKQNENLTRINGFTNLKNGSLVSLNDNSALLGINGFSILTSSDSIQINRNGNLKSVTGFDSLTNVSSFEIKDNPILTSIGKYSAFDSGNIVIDNNDTLIDITGFIQHTQGSIFIKNNANLTTIDAWENLSTGSSFDISDNPNLSMVIGFENYTNGIDSVLIKNNPMLSVCCWALPAIIEAKLNNGIVDVSGNGEGCENLDQIDSAPVLENCPVDLTINSGIDTCLSTATLTAPGISDNCGFTNFSFELISSIGTRDSGFVKESESVNILFNLGVNSITWEVSDESGNKDNCTTLITVVDEVIPLFTSAVPEDITISTEGNSCLAEVSITFPTFEDNCSDVNSKLSIYNSETNIPVSIYYDLNGGEAYIFDLEAGNFRINYQIVDASGNESELNSILTVEDNIGPEIILNQTDITINCNQSSPFVPQIGSSVFAIDACDGDVSSNMTVTSTTINGDCTFGQEQEITTYTYSASDNKGNTSEKSFIITILNNEAVDLGGDKVGCSGDSIVLSTNGLSGDFLWSTGEISTEISVSEAGLYAVTVTGLSGCCSIDEVNVSFLNKPDATATGGVITCSNSEVQLTGSSTTSDVSYSWIGPGGFKSSDQNPVVSSLGEYILTVTGATNCSASASAIVSADVSVPDVSAQGGSLNCSNNEVQLMGSSTTAGVSYSWTGPNNYTSTDQNPTVSDAGIYTLTVKTENDCSVTAYAEVIDDNTISEVELNDGIITCTNPEILLVPEVTGNIESYSWTGPNGLTATSETLRVTEAGNYSVTVTGSNTCISNTSIAITADIEIPNISVEGGIIDCTTSRDTLVGNSTTEGVSYEWSGPNEFKTSIANPVVINSGTYTLQVSSENGCTNSTSVELADQDLPIISANGGTIDCSNSAVTIMGSIATDDATFSWTGPDGFNSDLNNPEVTEQGEYTFTAKRASGCSAFKTVNVVIDTLEPEVQLFFGDVLCEEGSITISPSTIEGLEFEWEGPDGFTSTENNPQVSNAGAYNAIIKGANGCFTNASIELEHDIDFQAVVTVDGNTATLEITGGSGSFTVIWDDGSYQMPINLSVGEHMVTILDDLGCSKVVTFSIETSAVTDLVSELDFTLNPNPVLDQLNLKWTDNNINILDLNILDQSGKVVYHRDNNSPINTSHSINVTNWVTGVYYVYIISSKDVGILKFVKI